MAKIIISENQKGGVLNNETTTPNIVQCECMD